MLNALPFAASSLGENAGQEKEQKMFAKSALMSAIVGLALSTAVGALAPAHAQNAREAEILGFHQLCDKGDRKACVRFGILIGQNEGAHAEWRRLHPEWWWWER